MFSSTELLSTRPPSTRRLCLHGHSKQAITRSNTMQRRMLPSKRRIPQADSSPFRVDGGGVNEHDFILVTPDSIGMDKNGDIANDGINIPTLSFRSIEMDAGNNVSSMEHLMSTPLGNRFNLPMKRTAGDPFDGLMF